MGYGDPNCTVCHGAGWMMRNGTPDRCDCISEMQLKKLLGPIMRFRKLPMEVTGKPSELQNENQALVLNNENIARLMYFAANQWKDRGYSLIGVEELNIIGMRGTTEYKSLSDYAEAFPNFVVDFSSVNPMRGPGYREKDEMVLLDFLRMMERRAEKRVIVLIGPTAGEFKREHPALCHVLATMRFPYFNDGNKYAFAKNVEPTEAKSAEKEGATEVKGAKEVKERANDGD